MEMNKDWKSYHPIFQYPFIRSCYWESRDFAKFYLEGLRFRKDSIKKTKNLLYFSKVLSNSNSECKILFFESKFKDIILSLRKKKVSVGIIGRLRDIEFAFEIGIPYYSIFHWEYSLIKLFEKDPKLSTKKAQRLIGKFSKFLREKKVKFLVLSNDSLFVERFLIFSARMAGIITICIQDGLFHKKTNPKFIHGQFADYMFLWGESQKKFYEALEAKKKVAVLKILGFPFFTEENSSIDKRKICILGQPYENYNRELGKKKKEIFEFVISLLKRFGYTVVYKPHPGEISREFIPNNVDIYNKDLRFAFREFGVFISLTSTALLEASLNKKIAIQIYDEIFGGDHFESSGYSYTLMKENIISLPRIIQELDSAFPVPQDVIYRPKDIGKRFLELLEGIEREKKDNLEIMR